MALTKHTIMKRTTGRAKEYAPLCINHYFGCTQGCMYCYGRNWRFWTPEDWEEIRPREGWLKNVARCIDKNMTDEERDLEILLSFMGDPYNHLDTETSFTRRLIKLLINNDLRFTVLTKGGKRAERDFDLLESYKKCRFGTSLVFWDPKKAEEHEPRTASVSERIATINTAFDIGIKTWVSVEPVIYPAEALKVLNRLTNIVHHWKIGKLNTDHGGQTPQIYKDIEDRTDWVGFREEVTDILERQGADYYIKKSLTEL